MNKLPAGVSSAPSHKSHCKLETSERRHTQRGLMSLLRSTLHQLKPVAVRSMMLDGEMSALQSRLGALSKKQLQMDTMPCVQLKETFLATGIADFEQGISGSTESTRHLAKLLRSFILSEACCTEAPEPKRRKIFDHWMLEVIESNCATCRGQVRGSLPENNAGEPVQQGLQGTGCPPSLCV